MSFRGDKVHLLKKVSASVTDWVKGKNTIYWDHDLFPGIVFKFPDSLIRSSTKEVSAQTALRSFVNMVVPNKVDLVERIFAFGNLSPAEIKSTPEWNELLKALSNNLRQIMVRLGESAIIYWKGRLLDIATEPGVYDIDRSKQIPGIEIVYIATHELREHRDPKTGRVISTEGLLWGFSYHEAPPIKISNDPEYQKIKIRFGVNGTIILKIVDPAAFFINLVGNRTLETEADLIKMLAVEINQAFARQMASRSYQMIAENYQFLSDLIKSDPVLTENLKKYGIAIQQLYIKGVKPEPAKEEFIQQILEAALDMEEILARKKLEKKLKRDLELERLKQLQKLESETYVTKRTGDAEVEKAKTTAEMSKKAIEHTKDLLASVGSSKGVQVVQPGAVQQSAAEKQKEETKQETTGETKFCIYCGQKLPKEAKFCFACGKQQPEL